MGHKVHQEAESAINDIYDGKTENKNQDINVKVIIERNQAYLVFTKHKKVFKTFGIGFKFKIGDPLFVMVPSYYEPLHVFLSKYH